jgi:endoglucanase
MGWFATVLALGISSACVLGCGASKSVDFFSGSGGTPGVSGSNTGNSASAGTVASAGQSAAGSTGLGSSSSVGDGGSSAGGSDSSIGGSDSDDTSGASSGGAGGASVAGSANGGAGAPSDGACAPVADIGSGMSFASAGPVCLRVTLDIGGWGCSNFDGRTLKVNGTTVACAELPLPSKVDGAYYFDVSAGEHDYASLYWY